MRRVVLIALAFGASAGSAFAQADPEADEEATPEVASDVEASDTEPEPEARPWAEGVSEADQSAALALFRDGNESFGAGDYSVAARKYREALQHWDHPAIHGNLSVALIHLDDPIGAYHEVERALLWDDAPFAAHVHQQLATNRQLLRGQLATIVIVNEEEGAEVALDGDTVLDGAGRIERLMRAGSHRVVASKDGFLTFTRRIDAMPGTRSETAIELVPLERMAHFERRWPRWIPWATLMGGVVAVGVGAGLQLAGRAAINDYEAEIDVICATGCTQDDLTDAVLALERRGERLNGAAVVTLLLGAGVTVLGGALLGVNRLQRVDVDAEGRPLAGVSLQPTVDRRGAGLRLQGNF